VRSIFCTVSISLLSAAVGAAEDTPKEYRDLPRMSGWYRGQPVQFRVWNGMALVEGDMLLGPVEELLQGPEAKGRERADIAIAGEKYRWPGGVIPYEVDPNLPNPERVTKAIEEWQAKTSIRFQPRAGEDDYVRINRATSGCNSAVGHVGGRQTVNLADDCSSGNTIHELGHSVGLFHTQARINRNLHVRVRYENIDKDYWDQYDQQLLNGMDIGPYDYSSIMHYSSTGFTRNNRNSMDTAPPGIPVGQRAELSPGDVQAVARMYGQPIKEVTVSTFPLGLAIIVDGEQYTAPKSFTWAAGETHTLTAPEGFVSASPNRRLRFAKWSDGGDAEHTITVGDETLYIAGYALQLRLRTGVVPTGSGTVQVEPPSDDGFYTYGQVLHIRAVPQDDFQFLSWTPGAGAATYLAVNGQGNASNPVELALRNENAFYVANFTKSPITTVTSNPTGALVTVDGVAGYTPRAFLYDPGSTHTVSIADQQLVEGDTARLQFREWSNQGDRRQTITAGSGPLTLTASLNKQYQLLRYLTYVRLTTAAAPTFANIVTTPLNDDRFYDAGSTVQFSAQGPENVPFSNWFYDLGSSNATQQLVVNQQVAVSANFVSAPFFNASALVNQASQQPSPATPGALMMLYTPRIGPKEEVVLSAGDDGKYPTSTNGVSVRFGDTPAQIVRLAENSVTLLAPEQVGASSSVVVATRSPQGNYSRTMTAAQAAPGIYTLDGSGVGAAATEGPAARGQEFRVKVTGIGKDQPLGAEVGGVPAMVTNVAPGALPGSYVLTIATPEDAPTGTAVDLAVLAGGVRSQFGVTIEVQ
jgi:astacin